VPNYRRAHVPGGTFFFTLVTCGRAPFLCDEPARTLLRNCLSACRERHPFTIDAMVLLPDHLHAIWTLPPQDADFSTRFSVVKKSFTGQWLRQGGQEADVTDSRKRNRRRGIWQRRFWEHTIRDQQDLTNHLNYIHYNPVKHGMASCPHAWPYSTFGQYVKNGMYAEDWCCSCEHRTVVPPQFDLLNQTAME
jgi:putative transposase